MFPGNEGRVTIIERRTCARNRKWIVVGELQRVVVVDQGGTQHERKAKEKGVQSSSPGNGKRRNERRIDQDREPIAMGSEGGGHGGTRRATNEHVTWNEGQSGNAVRETDGDARTDL